MEAVVEKNADRDDNPFGKGLYETRRLAKAIIQRWPIRPETRSAVILRLEAVILNPRSSPREVASASRALLAAEAQNMEDERALQPQSPQLHLHHHEHAEKSAVDLSKIPQTDLDRIEAELIALSQGKPLQSPGGAVEAEPVPVHGGSVAMD